MSSCVFIPMIMGCCNLVRSMMLKVKIMKLYVACFSTSCIPGVPTQMSYLISELTKCPILSYSSMYCLFGRSLINLSLFKFIFQGWLKKDYIYTIIWDEFARRAKLNKWRKCVLNNMHYYCRS